jgi:NADH-quinone oxidoreductase subunit G
MSDPQRAARQLAHPVRVVIDGREIQAEAGEMLLQVALDNGVEIPHYCYHPKLSIDGSCRMCQVKIERMPKLAIACNQPVSDGMVVDTKGPEVVHARSGVMELLLVNHPLDCPICDQAGECYLQDYSFAYGRQEARTTSPRRKGLKRHPIGPRVIFDEERCILCRRCVRFTSEISKTNELRVFGIGDHSHIGTLPGRGLDNDYSINTADICPVGALLSKDFHHKRRVWFLQETESVCPSCSNGCNIKIGTYGNEIQRLVPRRNDAVNDTWMCDYGRLRYEFAQDETRVRQARVRASASTNGNPSGEVSVDEAIRQAAALIRSTIERHGATSIGVITSAHLTNEESHCLVGLARESIGTPHLDLVVPLGPADDFLIRPDKAANARGARDMGVSPGEGSSAEAILDAASRGELKLLYVVGSDDLLMVFGEERVVAACAALEALIVQDANVSALTSHGHVVLPGLVWAEKEGTFTNHAGRVQRIRRALQPRGEVLSDGEVLRRLQSLLREGAASPVGFDAPGVLAEIAAKVPGYAGLSLTVVGSHGFATERGGQPADGVQPSAAPG